jgi:hypothetical protein
MDLLNWTTSVFRAVADFVQLRVCGIPASAKKFHSRDYAIALEWSATRKLARTGLWEVKDGVLGGLSVITGVRLPFTCAMDYSYLNASIGSPPRHSDDPDCA